MEAELLQINPPPLSLCQQSLPLPKRQHKKYLTHSSDGWSLSTTLNQRGKLVASIKKIILGLPPDTYTNYLIAATVVFHQCEKDVIQQYSDKKTPLPRNKISLIFSSQ